MIGKANMNLDVFQFEEEIDRLERMAHCFEACGMASKAEGYRLEINELRLRLTKLEKIEHWEAENEYS